MSKTVVLAFSGGLDTCWCIPHIMQSGWNVVTATVDVGGFSPSDLKSLEKRSKELGALQHLVINAKDEFFQEVLRYLIAGNVTRGGIYPLCVGAERALQAREVAKVAQKLGAQAIGHGCTAAGNDQIRFEVAIRSYAPELEMLAPVRDETPTRVEQLALLESLGFATPEKVAYSINSGLWGVTIGGTETTGTQESIPEDQWIRTNGAFDLPKSPLTITLGFQSGIPTNLNGEFLGPVELIEKLDIIAGSYGMGRGIHLGETILGIKGRVAFEAPAATVILNAHRELEKLVLTKKQQQAKDHLSSLYGEMVHEGLFSEPACRDIEAFLVSSQTRVTGEVKMTLRPGMVFVDGVSSPYSLHSASRAVYGETVGEWTPQDAKGFGRIYGMSGILHARAGGSN